MSAGKNDTPDPDSRSDDPGTVPDPMGIPAPDAGGSPGPGGGGSGIGSFPGFEPMEPWPEPTGSDEPTY
jgi:hypothetical protein